jgi:hypothetical protein
MLYAFAQLVEIPAALDFVFENCWEFLKSRPTSLNLAESAPPSLPPSSQPTARLPARLPAISNTHAAILHLDCSKFELQEARNLTCNALSRPLATSTIELRLLWPGKFAPAVLSVCGTKYHRSEEASLWGTRYDIAVERLQRRHEYSVVGPLSFLATWRYGTHARGSASQYGFIETTEPRDAFWLLVSVAHVLGDIR